MIADGGDALTHLATLRDQGKLFGAVASEPTAWRAVERVDAAHLQRLRAVRAAARERAWAAGAGPDIAAGLTIDLDATITIARVGLRLTPICACHLVHRPTRHIPHPLPVRRQQGQEEP